MNSVIRTYAREKPSGARLALTTCMSRETMAPRAEHEKDSTASDTRWAKLIILVGNARQKGMVDIY